jgi:hypothetical protein
MIALTDTFKTRKELRKTRRAFDLLDPSFGCMLESLERHGGGDVTQPDVEHLPPEDGDDCVGYWIGDRLSSPDWLNQFRSVCFDLYHDLELKTYIRTAQHFAAPSTEWLCTTPRCRIHLGLRGI